MFIECLRPSRSDMPIPPRMAFLDMVNTGPEWPEIRALSSWTVASSLASGTSRLMIPNSSARSAEMGSPVRTSSSAIFGPTRNGRIVEARGGNIPIVISGWAKRAFGRSEEHTSELQSLAYLVCRLLLEKKKKKITQRQRHHIIAKTYTTV